MNQCGIECTISDHFGIYSAYSIGSATLRVNDLANRFVNKVNFSKLDGIMLSTDLDTLVEGTDANKAMSNLVDAISGAIQCSTYRSHLNARNYRLKEWMTDSLLQSVRKRDRMFKKTHKLPENDPRKIEYKNYRNTLKAALRTAKRVFLTARLVAASGNIREQYKIIREKLNLPGKDVNILDKLMQISNNAPNTLNDYFVSVGAKTAQSVEHLKVYNDIPALAAENSFSLINTTIVELCGIIDDLNDHKASGADNISNKIIKRYKDLLLPILVRLFNLCMDNGVFPDTLKIAVVVPVFKSGSPVVVANYRPNVYCPLLPNYLKKYFIIKSYFICKITIF